MREETSRDVTGVTDEKTTHGWLRAVERRPTPPERPCVTLSRGTHFEARRRDVT